MPTLKYSRERIKNLHEFFSNPSKNKKLKNISIKTEVRKKQEIKEAKPIVCKFCDSPNIIKYGKDGKKQVYKYKNCNRKFSYHSQMQYHTCNAPRFNKTRFPDITLISN